MFISSSGSCGYASHNNSTINYGQQANLSSGVNGLSQSDLVSSIHPMNLDLYGLSLSPSSTGLLANGSSSSPPAATSTDHPTSTTSSDLPALSTSLDSISSSMGKQQQQQQGPPVIYPWMRKVHINNPGRVALARSRCSSLWNSYLMSERRRRRGSIDDDRQHAED